MKKTFRWVFVLVALAAGGAFGFIRYTKAHKPVGPSYSTVTVDRGRIAARVTATGTLSALVTVLVGSQVSGRIETLKVDFNSPVKKGQVVATIEPSLFQAAVEQANANYLSAKADADKARAQALDAERQNTRAKTLGEQKLIAQADVDTAEANYNVAKAQVAAAEASVAQARASQRQAQVNLKYTTIVSPIDGVVISRSVDVGQTVAASLQAPTLFTIAQDLTKMQVDTSVAEGDVGKIKNGMPVTFTVDAYPGRRFDGTVRQVRDAATTVQNVVTYDAVIDVDNGERLLKPGMTATVTFTPAERNDVLRVANAALRYHPDPATVGSSGAGVGVGGGTVPASAARGPRPLTPTGARGAGGDKSRKTVYRLRGSTVTPVEIQVGLSDGSLTEIVSGDLHEGDTIVTEQLVEQAKPSMGLPGMGTPRRM